MKTEALNLYYLHASNMAGVTYWSSTLHIMEAALAMDSTLPISEDMLKESSLV